MNGGHRAAGWRASRTAFTLIELMLVIVILGIVAAILVPQLGAGMSGAKLRVGARTAIQAARYARTMALLHQAETDLVLLPKQGLVRVEAAPVTRENAVTVENAPDEGMDKEVAYTNQPVALATAASFADEIRAEFQCNDVAFRFLGYTDGDEEVALPPADPGREIRIHFRSNGICRPFRLSVLRDETDRLEIRFDITGSGTVVSP